MNERVEMPVGEWFVRLLCKLVAFGVVMLGLVGFLLIGMLTILPLLDRGEYAGVACTGIGCVALMYGLTPFGIAVDTTLLRFCAGMEPLPPRDEK